MPSSPEFESLYNQHKDRLYRLCQIMVHQADEADDLFQEVMVNIWRSLTSFEGRSTIDTWMYRVVLNTSITFNSKAKKAQQTRFHTTPLVMHHEVIERPELEVVFQAAKQLSQAERAILGLYLEDFSYQEISIMLGLSMSNVGVKINRIKYKLKTIINQ